MDQSRNPYQPPQANLDSAVDVREFNRAGRGRRFGTFVVDYIGTMLLAMVFGFVVVLVFGVGALETVEKIPDLVLGVGLWLVYYVFFEGIWARTPGKWIFGTVVVTEDGRKPRLGIIIKRTLCRMIPFEPLSFFGERGWHDSISDTFVALTRAE